MRFPSEAVNKTVNLRFSGHDLRLHLTHALFSSHRIDDGTMLLLKTLAQQKAIPLEGKVLDAGCGVGPLALALKKFRPELKVSARDRLALACAFTAENARINHLEVDVAPGLLLDASSTGWHLIVSNLPAKAGEPVLRDFVQRSLTHLSEGGLVAVVLVTPLASAFSLWLDEAGAEVVYSEATPAYHVFHFRPQRTAAAPEAPFPAVYARSVMPFTVGTRSLRQQTFYGLPNFDALDYRWQVTIGALATVSWKKTSLLVWEPVQGHVATWLSTQLLPGGVLHLAGNDLLALQAAAHNLNSLEPAVANERHCVPSPLDLADLVGQVGGVVFQVHSDPEVPWVEAAREALLALLPPGAPFLVNGTSTDLARFLENTRGFRKVHDEKHRGWRCVVFLR